MQEKQSHKEQVEFLGNMEHFTNIMSWVQKKAKEARCVFSDIYKIELAMEEAIVNVIRYAYPDKEGKIEIFCEYQLQKKIQFKVVDKGIPFNPLEHKSEPQSIDDGIESIEEGGLGIAIIKDSMDEVVYERKDSKNILILTKKISPKI